MTDFKETVRGIVAMLLCCFFFIINDTMVKAVGETVPLGQVLVLRGIAGTLLVGLFAWRLGALRGFRGQYSGKVGWRIFGEIAATLLYLSALIQIPIANASAIAQAAPLVITAAGAIFLGEQVGWRRWAAVIVGFLGILLIVRPGAEGFNAWALVTLASVFAIAVRDIVTRFIPPATSTLYITFVTSACVTVVGAGLSLTETWAPIGLPEALLILGSAVFVLLGYVFSIVAMRHGDVSIVAPFRYSFIPYAILIGWLVWGDVPDAVTVLGIAIVVATGVYTFYREHKRARAARLAADASPAVA
jgi:drug/metabolite transporter (DMT)-like permease